MLSAVEKSLRALQPGGEIAAPLPLANDTGMAVLAAWMEPRHTLLLRTLLEQTHTPPLLPGSPNTLLRVGSVLEDLRRDSRLKYAEFREKWDLRLDTAALLPFLQRNQWFVPHPQGGITLIGKGTRKEAKMLYLQTLHDMASDCARQWAAISGRWQSLQAQFVSEWHAESVGDEASKVLPALEASVRAGEFEAWKSLRLSLGDLSENAFVNAVGRWDQRSFLSPESLVRDIAAPWRRVEDAGNGFIGFMRALSRLGERLTLAMLNHYDRKWELFLRGFAEK